MNDTDTGLGVHMAYGYFPPRSWSSYPDTLLPKVDEELFKVMFMRVAPHNQRDLISEIGTWRMNDNHVIDEMIPVDTVCIFIIHPDTFQKYGYLGMVEDYNILARYDLSKKDLKQLNADIHYPPTPAMQNMKMYPSYQQILNNISK